MAENQEVTIKVKRGVKVHVVETDDLSDDDSRIPSDRDMIVAAPTTLKLAISELHDDKRPTAKASVMLRCG